MPLTYIGDDDFRLVFSFARLASDDEVGTEHLLHGLVRAVPKIAHLLDAFDVTPLVVQSVLKDRAGRWDGPEGGPRDQTPERAERVEPDLRLMRDRLIGRERYRGRGLRNILMSFVVRVRINYARTPVLWASLEADEIAYGRGGATRTDDILVARLRAYAVAEAYPHLWRAVPEQYVGVGNLVEGGLDYRTATRTAAQTDLGEDALPPKSLLKQGEQWPKDTTSLLQLLRAYPGNRSAQILAERGIA
jgi:hypothetical protein